MATTTGKLIGMIKLVLLISDVLTLAACGPRLRLTYNIAHALCATGNCEEAEALAEENLVLQNRVYGTAHPNAAAALELVGHVRAGLAARA